MASALTSENALSIEYDESTVCDVCKDVSIITVYGMQLLTVIDQCYIVTRNG